MVLLDLLHVQRAGFFRFLKLGIDKELSQLNINVDNTRLQVIPFFGTQSKSDDNESKIDHITSQQFFSNQLFKEFALNSKHNRFTFLATRVAIPCLTNRRFVRQGYKPSIFLQNKQTNFTCTSLKEWGPSRREKWQSFASKYRCTYLPNMAFPSVDLLRMRSKKMHSLQSNPYLHTCLPCLQSMYASRFTCLTCKAYRRFVRHVSKVQPCKAGKGKFHKQRQARPCIPCKAGKGIAIKAFNNLSLNQNSCFRLIASKYTPREAILYQKSWSCKLVVKVLLTVHEKKTKNTINKTNKKPFRCKTQAKSVHSEVRSFASKNQMGVAWSIVGKKHENKAVNWTKNLVKTNLLENRIQDLISKISNTKKQTSSKTILFEETIQQKSKQKRNHELFLVLGELPLMTKRGHFIIHGSPRVILSQLIRTPGIYFTQKNNELQADCVPEQGPWLCVYKNISDNFVSEPIPKVVAEQPWAELNSLAISCKTSTPCLPPFPNKSIGSENCKKSKYNKAKDTYALTKQPKKGYLQSKDYQVDNKKINNITKNFTSSFKSLGQGEPASYGSYFCYTKQFSSIPFSLIYSTFRVFELHSQFTDQTLLLTKLKTLEKIRKFKETITTLLTFTWKKRVRRRLQRLYTKRCFISTQQFEKTKLLFRLKKKLILGPLSRKSFNEKLGVSSCINTAISQNAFNNEFFGLTATPNSSFVKHNKVDPSYRALVSAHTCCYEETKSTSLKASYNDFYVKPVAYKSMLIPCKASRVTNRRFVSTNQGQSKIYKQAIPCKASNPYGVTNIAYHAYKQVGVAKQKHRYALQVRGCLPLLRNVYAKACLYASRAYKQTKQSETMWLNSTTLLSRDLALIVQFLDGYKMIPQDDIDDLNNQRIRTSSDQIQQQMRIGFFRFKKMFVKLIASGGASQTITDFLNGALREFFGSNPLSQFLDQTNPLAEITHKRRISKLGLGGIQRESATLKVRTIHSTYFGRICPIETPEGINAGLVNSLTCLSRVNAFGQLVTPLSLLMEGQKQEQFFYYSNQEKKAISTTDTALLKFSRLPNQFVYTKNESQFQQLEANKIKLRVKSDLQTISLATALIPFLAYDDANRALMGSNMQRQAVPLILPERPIIRTGMESLVINESGHSFQSPFGGFVSYISAQYVVILCDTLNKRLLI